MGLPQKGSTYARLIIALSGTCQKNPLNFIRETIKLYSKVQALRCHRNNGQFTSKGLDLPLLQISAINSVSNRIEVIRITGTQNDRNTTLDSILAGILEYDPVQSAFLHH